MYKTFVGILTILWLAAFGLSFDDVVRRTVYESLLIEEPVPEGEAPALARP